jgi:hypothetical protein
MNPLELISQDVFDKVRSRFQNLEMGDESGAVTIDPKAARFFDFDFVSEDVDLGRVSISINDLGSLKIYYSQGITENQDDEAKKVWFKFLKEMRFFAMRRKLRFDTRDIAKNNLDKNDFQHLATTQASNNGEEMNTMNESRWNHKSTKKTSRAVKGTTEVIVRHSAPMDEMYPGARSQRKNIKAIFIQNKDGERFKYPFVHTAGAFAMAQHVDHGGVPHDPAGKAIIRMSEEMAQLAEFRNKVRSANLHPDASGITERAMARLTELKSQIDALGKRHHYESWIAEFQEPQEPVIGELDDVTMETYKQKFTETNFKEDLASFFPLLHRIMQETNSVNLEDFVGEEVGDQLDIDQEVKQDTFEQFQVWAEAVEQGQLTSDQIQSLSSELPQLKLGMDGAEAWETLSGILELDDANPDDMDLKAALQGRASDQATDNNAAGPAAEIFKSWVDLKHPDWKDSLMQILPQAEPTPDAEPEQQPAAENEDGLGTGEIVGETSPKKSMIEMIAEKVKSFHNLSNESVAPFRDPETVATDIKKQVEEEFGESAGEKAREVALAYMERCNSGWQKGTDNNLDELARLRELVGNVKKKIENIGNTEQADQEVDEAPGAIRKALGGLALAGTLAAGSHALDQQELQGSKQLTSLNQAIDDAKKQGNNDKVRELEQRRDNHIARIRAGKGDIQGHGGSEVKVVPEEVDMIRKLAGLKK